MDGDTKNELPPIKQLQPSVHLRVVDEMSHLGDIGLVPTTLFTFSIGLNINEGYKLLVGVEFQSNTMACELW